MTELREGTLSFIRKREDYAGAFRHCLHASYIKVVRMLLQVVRRKYSTKSTKTINLLIVLELLMENNRDEIF